MNNILKFVLAGGLGLALTSCGTQKKLEALQTDYQKCLSDSRAEGKPYSESESKSFFIGRAN
jgi:hypothetical protein